MQNAKEIVVLRQMIEESVGRKIVAPTDFSFLTGVIAERCHETLGVTTLKRIWGYVEGYDTMRNSTLSILARCVGFHDWDDFLQNHAKRNSSSQVVLGQAILASQLETGERVRVTWAPDRRCVFSHRGDGCFEVLSSENSKLKVGDTFHCAYMIIGQPLYLDNFVRGNKPPTMFVIGNKGGLTAVERM